MRDRWRARSLADESGQGTIEAILAVAVIFWWILFGTYGWMVSTKYDQFRTVEQRYMSVLQINGELTTQDENAMNQDLEQYGFNPANVTFQGSTPFNVFVSRGNTVTLNMGYPLATIIPQFWWLVGQNPSTVGDSWANGMQTSEAP